MSDRIETAIKRVAEALNRLEAADNELTVYFEENRDYNDEVLYQLREGNGKLGYVLACLTTWNDELEDGSDDLDTYFRGDKVGESKDGMYTYKTITKTVNDNKPYKLTLVNTGGKTVPLGYYRTEGKAASSLSLDYNVSDQEILSAWRADKPYEIKGVGSFMLTKEEKEDESED